MKALPLWQPWASLVAVGAKRVETRSWPAPPWVVGQRIVIHATKTDKDLPKAAVEPFAGYLPAPDRLPLGALICTVGVLRCSEITEDGARLLMADHPHEFAFGDYTGPWLNLPQRYAWVLVDPRPFTPIPWRGSQGMFDIPEDRIPGVTPQGVLL